MKSALLPLMFLLCCTTAFAGENWISYFKNSEVEILYRQADCNDNANGIHQQKYLLKVVNLQNKKVEVAFSKELTFSNGTTVAADVKNSTIQLEANATAEGKCEVKDNHLYIFIKQLNFSSTELKKFELENISVKPLQ